MSIKISKIRRCIALGVAGSLAVQTTYGIRYRDRDRVRESGVVVPHPDMRFPIPTLVWGSQALAVPSEATLLGVSRRNFGWGALARLNIVSACFAARAGLNLGPTVHMPPGVTISLIDMSVPAMSSAVFYTQIYSRVSQFFGILSLLFVVIASWVHMSGRFSRYEGWRYLLANLATISYGLWLSFYIGVPALIQKNLVDHVGEKQFTIDLVVLAAVIAASYWIHELGHWLMAKLFRVPVSYFGMRKISLDSIIFGALPTYKKVIIGLGGVVGEMCLGVFVTALPDVFTTSGAMKTFGLFILGFSANYIFPMKLNGPSDGLEIYFMLTRGAA